MVEKREVSNNHSGRITKILESLDYQDGVDSFLPEIRIFTANSLYEYILKNVGESTANSFSDLVLYGKVNENNDELLKFLKGRTDIISRHCLKKLGVEE